MGIKSELKPTYSLALGSNEVNLLELTSAYGSFATQGLHTEAHGIRRILNRQGDVIWSADVQPQRALDADSAAIMTWMLRNVVTNGTGAAAQLNDRQVAGKTGTSDEARDLWFIGYIPQVVAGVWLGNDNNRPTNGSSTSAAYTWHEFMEKAVEGMPVEKFPARPKLENRKGTIKAQPIKPKKIVNTSLASNDQQSDQDDGDSSTRRRRRRRSSYSEVEQQSNYTSRRRRRYRQQEESTSRRRRRFDSQSGNNSGAESSRSGRRKRSQDSNSAPPVNNNSSGSSPSKPSWRERLKPGSSSSSPGE
jgi:penicillin-binding protein 1A